jgi:tetratricopeptide (TPR) repeat protein
VARYALGRILAAAGDAPQARSWLQAARSHHPEAGHAALLLAGVLKDRNELGPAIEVLERSVAETGDYAPGRAALGRLYEIVGRDEEARRLLGGVLGIEGGRGPRGYQPDADDYVALALADGRLRYAAEAEAALAKAVAAGAKSPRLARAQALVQAVRGEAAPAARALARVQPQDLALKLDLGSVQRQAGNVAAAEAAFAAALRQDPGNVEALVGLGQLYLMMPDRSVQAIETFEKALVAWDQRPYVGRPRRAQIRVGLGRAYLMAGPQRHPVKARAALAAAVEDAPTSPVAQYHLGRSYLADGDAERAAATFARAVQLDPRLAEAHFFGGEALRAREPGRARAAYQQYLRLAPGGEHAAAARRALDQRR